MPAWSDVIWGALIGAGATVVVAGATVIAAYIGGGIFVKIGEDARQQNEGLTARQFEENRRMIALRFLYDLTLKLHESDLLLKLKWHTFEFKLPADVFELIPPGMDTHLNTDREEKLIWLLDVLQMVETLKEEGVLTDKDLSRTTVGYAIKLRDTNSAVQQYINHMKLRDKKIKYEGPAWKPLEPAITASA